MDLFKNGLSVDELEGYLLAVSYVTQRGWIDAEIIRNLYLNYIPWGQGLGHINVEDMMTLFENSDEMQIKVIDSLRKLNELSKNGTDDLSRKLASVLHSISYGVRSDLEQYQDEGYLDRLKLIFPDLFVEVNGIIYPKIILLIGVRLNAIDFGDSENEFHGFNV